VEGDPFLLRRALSNLLDNALDFSPEGSVVQLSLTAQRRSALIAVRDHGCGIPGYAQDKVFEKFYSLARPHSQKKKHRPGALLRQGNCGPAPRAH
jgi:two-component system sensor histidine kinase CreC